MKYLALFLALFLASPTTAQERKLSPVKWWAVYVDQTNAGRQFIDFNTIRRGYPKSYVTRFVCEVAGQLQADQWNEAAGGMNAYANTTVVYCIAARNKLQLRQHLRLLDLNFGGRPA